MMLLEWLKKKMTRWIPHPLRVHLLQQAISSAETRFSTAMEHYILVYITYLRRNAPWAYQPGIFLENDDLFILSSAFLVNYLSRMLVYE